MIHWLDGLLDIEKLWAVTQHPWKESFRADLKSRRNKKCLRAEPHKIKVEIPKPLLKYAIEQKNVCQGSLTLISLMNIQQQKTHIETNLHLTSLLVMYCICYITQSILRSSSYLLIPMLTLLSSGNHAQTNSSQPRLTFLTLASYSRCVFSYLLSVWPSILVYASFIKFPPPDFCEFSESLFLGGREKPLLSACI